MLPIRSIQVINKAIVVTKASAIDILETQPLIETVSTGVASQRIDMSVMDLIDLPIELHSEQQLHDR